MLKKINYLIVFSVMLFFGGVLVNAATLTDKGTTKIYYNNNSAYSYYNKKINDKIAYCIQLGKKVPAEGYDKYSRTNGWKKESSNSFVAAQIIKKGKDKYSGQEEYMNIQYALNCFRKYDGYYSKACSKKEITDLISSAKSTVSYYKYGSNGKKLPNIKVSDHSINLSTSDVKNEYVSDEIKLSNLVKKYGGSSYSTEAKYTIKAESSNGTAYICTSKQYSSENCSGTKVISGINNYSFYVVLRGSNSKAGEVKVIVSGSNKSTYPASYLWIPATTKYQRMVTLTSDVTIERSVKKELEFEYTAPSTYNVSLKKVDQDGEALVGANLELYTASDSVGTKDIQKICSITGNSSSCSLKGFTEGTNGYSENRFLCYREISAPSGYKKIVGTKCVAIKLAETIIHYYNGNTSISKGEYDKYNGASKYCISGGMEEIEDSSYISGVLAAGFDNNENLSSGECNNEPSFEGEEIISYKTICVDGTGGYDSTNNYCNHEELTVFNETKGSYKLTVSNVLNDVKISKKSITNREEVPGAELAIYTTNADGSCSNNLAKAFSFSYSDITLNNPDTGDDSNAGSGEGEDGTGSTGGEGGSDDSDDSTDAGDAGAGGDDSEEDVINDPAKDGLKWTSSYSPAVIQGLAAGTYCLVEEVAPKGYKKFSSTVKFSIDDEGTTMLVDNGGEKVSDITEDNTINLYNDVTELSISKTDIATGKELPGATLSICEAVEENGKYEMVVGNNDECSVVSLADGSLATWTSTDKPHKIKGLGAGTYYLVEKIAPKNYSTAESILFKVSEDGKILDINNKEVTNNKIIMKDKRIEEVKTGDLPIIGVLMICLISLSTAVICYYRSNKNFNLG